MKKTYECMLLLANREVKKGWDELKTTVNGLFDKHGAEVVSARRWDERRLTFPIKRQQRATYLLMYFNADAPQVQAVRRDMEFSEAVLRNFVTSCEKIPEAAFEPEDSFDIESIRIDDEPAASAAPAATTEEATADSKSEDAAATEAAPAGAAAAEATPAGGAAPESGDEKPAGDDVPSGDDVKEDK